MRNWLKTLLFISAFSPVLITLAVIRYDLNGFNAEVCQLAIVGVIGSVLPLLIMKGIAKSGESLRFDAKKVESNDFMLFAFVASYFSPLLLKASDFSLGQAISILAVVGFLLWLIGSMPAHPLLRFLKFKFYKVESSSGVVYVLISKKEIRDPKDIKAVKRISDSMLMEVTL